MLQNYTGILYGLVYYLCHLNKQIDIVNLINQSKKRERKEKLNGIMIGTGSIIALAITGIILI